MFTIYISLYFVFAAVATFLPLLYPMNQWGIAFLLAIKLVEIFLVEGILDQGKDRSPHWRHLALALMPVVLITPFQCWLVSIGINLIPMLCAVGIWRFSSFDDEKNWKLILAIEPLRIWITGSLWGDVLFSTKYME